MMFIIFKMYFISIQIIQQNNEEKYEINCK